MTPHLNFVQVYHHSPRGLSLLQLGWPPIPDVYFLETGEGSTTFSQPGNITPPRVDGFGLTQIMAHLDGHKVWITWPPSESNLRAVRDHDRAIGPYRECRLEHWFEHLEDPQVFLIRKGDSFFLGSSVIHACISVTGSAHYRLFCWEKKSLALAKLNIKILRDGFAELGDARTEQKRKHRKEDKLKNASPLEVRKRKMDREEEDSKYETCLEFYKGCRQEWEQSDRKMWRRMNADNSNVEIDVFISNTEHFMSKIQ